MVWHKETNKNSWNVICLSLAIARLPSCALFCPALFFSYCQTINVKKIQVNNIFTFIAQILLFFMFGIIKQRYPVNIHINIKIFLSFFYYSFHAHKWQTRKKKKKDRKLKAWMDTVADISLLQKHLFPARMPAHSRHKEGN